MSFLHKNCKEGMCTDCIEIAEEYENLLQLRTNALAVAEHEREKIARELEIEKRKSVMYESVAKAGFADVVCAWLDNDIRQLLEKATP